MVFLRLAVSNSFYYHLMCHFVTSMRGSLISAIYSKTVDPSITVLVESVAVTLMSNDTRANCLGMETINSLWAVPLELSIAIYMLYRQLGVACAAPDFLTVFSTVGILGIARYMGVAQKIWMQDIPTRVDTTAAMLSSMKSVKMLGFTDRLGNLVQGLRVAELQLAKMFRKLLIVHVFLANILIILAPVATLVFSPSRQRERMDRPSMQSRPTRR